MKIAAVIPVYNHSKPVEQVAANLIQRDLPVYLIDDGSAPEEAKRLDALAAKFRGIRLYHQPKNQGKGAAVMTGFRLAAADGFTHVLQIDADGQHDAAAVPELVRQAQAHSSALVTGSPRYDASAPKARSEGRKLTRFWVDLNTLSHRIEDSMCGFRVYPLKETLPVLPDLKHSLRMDFDIEIIVRMDWAGVPIVNIPVEVRYPEDGVSHFKVFRDNVRISWMHMRLFFGMLRRFPELRRRRREGV
jgi:glycosyltransferase involved in cell wall biosynthesis